MMEKAIEQLGVLIESGERFTYGNFSGKGGGGFPSSFTPEWVAWTTRCNSILLTLFGAGSPQDRAIETGLRVELIGNGPAKFEQCKGYIIGTLKSAIDVLNDDIFHELVDDKADAPGMLSNRVFVVHGHDEVAKNSLEIFLSEIGLEPVVLHRQADEGQTIIEKFEKHSDVGYAFILLTPDDVSYSKDEDALPDDQRRKECRARPNVIFEFGFFVGRLERKRVCCLYTGDVALPSDVSGMSYKQYDQNIEEVAYSIIKDLKAAGYSLK